MIVNTNGTNGAGNLTVANNVTWASNQSLTLTATNNITITGNISSTSAAGNAAALTLKRGWHDRHQWNDLPGQHSQR